MAKVTYSKLNIKPICGNVLLQFKDQQIEVKTYLPVEEKLKMVTEVLNLVVAANNFINPLTIKVAFGMKLIKYYTNISFTEKQLEDSSKLYDAFVSSGLMDMIEDAIPKEEFYKIGDAVYDTIRSYTEYKNSFMGMLEGAAADYQNSEFNFDEVVKKVTDNEALPLLKQIAPLLGNSD